ncbi:E3 ubiquitin-protein ligase MARCHF4 isoform X1 [Alosa sapidissima]|uniref:E3 ubiquitin-protein ligase MARCHF4 isoform X1 n=1 Tax=Alosa sapidissima TaxID=34773 RepID=UPI001C0958B1|nr:E3 ubiquitin-protein ligase MARCHF4 isoform X1 [Alosa sapidissima]
MLLAISIILWCWGLLSRRPMLCRQGMQKGRCCVLFSDLKVFLLRPPTPSEPPPALPLMSTLNTESHVTAGTVERNNSSAGATESTNGCLHNPAGWTEPPSSGENVGTKEEMGGEEWESTTMELPGTLDCGSSSEDNSKEKYDERTSLNSCTDSGVRSPLCRICFQGPEQGELLSPCRCSGSVQCTHEPCLIKWISERGSWSCELCSYKYQVIGISTKNPLQWQTISLTVIEKVQIAAAVLGTLFLMASISWLVWSSLSPSAKWQRQDLLFQICYAMYGFMDLVCIALIVHEGPSVFRIFNRWQAVNQQWKVLNYDKMKDTDEHQKAGASLRTLSFPGPRGSGPVPPNGHPGSAEGSPSLSSLMAATETPTAVPLDSNDGGLAVEPEVQDSSEPSGGGTNHCAYSILQRLSLQLRTPPPREQPGSNRELVMRVTTV